MDNTVNNDVVIKKDGKDLSPDEMAKLGIKVYKSESAVYKPKTFKEFVSAFNTLMESYDLENDEDIDIDKVKIKTKDFGDDDDLLNELNNIYTPILVTQELEGDISGPIQEACSQDNILFERNIIKFDRDTKLAQLIGVCALLINRQKNSEEYQMFRKASQIKRDMKLRMQKEDHEEATALATKYLDKIMANSTSSVARKAAETLSNANK